jgi:hypothetical protein
MRLQLCRYILQHLTYHQQNQDFVLARVITPKPSHILYNICHEHKSRHSCDHMNTRKRFGIHRNPTHVFIGCSIPYIIVPVDALSKS